MIIDNNILELWIQWIGMCITASQLKHLKFQTVKFTCTQYLRNDTHIDNTLPTMTISPLLFLSIHEDKTSYLSLDRFHLSLKISLTSCYNVTTWFANCPHRIKTFFDVLVNLEIEIHETHQDLQISIV